ncbi:MAG TPA: hypothetical protein VMD02_07690 [Candidatus Omnitrophota bacterium]|nr:hypothetical protein [Candidatus Omnitrophota bacterium]
MIMISIMPCSRPTYNFTFLTGEKIRLFSKEMTQIGLLQQHRFLERPTVSRATFDFKGSELGIEAELRDFPFRSGMGLKLVPILVFNSRSYTSAVRLGTFDLANHRSDPGISETIPIRRTYFFDYLSTEERYRLRKLNEIQLVLAEPAGFNHYNEIWIADYHKLEGGWV